jgi:DNA polymerase
MKSMHVMWVGLSAKKTEGGDNFEPLDAKTNTGKLIAEIEKECKSTTFYKTNLVKFAPLDKKGKLRYPTSRECLSYYPELQSEIDSVNPKIVVLLGLQTAKFVTNQLGLNMPSLSYSYEAISYRNRWYVPIHHPSYIMIYKRKEKDVYVQALKSTIQKLSYKQQCTKYN